MSSMRACSNPSREKIARAERRSSRLVSTVRFCFRRLASGRSAIFFESTIRATASDPKYTPMYILRQLMIQPANPSLDGDFGMNKQPIHSAETVAPHKAICTAGMLLILIGLVSGCSEKKSALAAAAPRAMPVTAVAVQPSDVPLTGEWVGTLDGNVNAQIQPQASGYLIKQDYREGSQVSKGQVLFEIDPRPFQAALDQARGQLDQAKGQVLQAQAQLGLADINVNRDTPLAQA